MVTGDDGEYLFKGVYPGSYIVKVEVPSIYVSTIKDAGDDDAIDSDVALQDGVYVTDIFSVQGGDIKLDLDAGFIIDPDRASIEIIKTAGDAEDGATYTAQYKENVVYTYKVTNIGKVYLKDVTVTDDKIAGWSHTIEGLLAPGETVVITAEQVVSSDVTNIGTVVGTPTDEEGRDYDDIDTVKDDDDADVVINEETKPLANVGNFVWNDINGNGIQDNGEMGVAKIPVSLVDANGTVVATTTTDANGKYLFENVEAGTYTVKFDVGNWSVTEQAVGDDRAVDSNANSEGVTESFVVEAGVDRLDIDCGLRKGVPPGICDLIDVSTRYGAVIGGDFKALGGDSENNLIVVGSVDIYSGFSVGYIGPGYGREREPAPMGTDALVVGGDYTEQAYPEVNGNIVYAGAYNNTATGFVDTRPYELRKVSEITFDESWNVPEDGSGKTIKELIADLNTFSAVVANFESTEGASVTLDGSDIKFEYEGTEKRVVFTVSEAYSTISGVDFKINVPEGTKVIINFLADTYEQVNSQIWLTGTKPEHVMYNFPNATSIKSTGVVYHGTLIAPKASIEMNGGASINGFVYIGGNASLINYGPEFHDFDFDVFDCEEYFAARPELDVTVIAGTAVDGTLYNAVKGESVEMTQIVRNTGNYTLSSVMLSDVLGRDLLIGDLEAGKAITNIVKVVVGEAGVASYTASAVGTSYDEATGTFKGIAIEDSDVASVRIHETEAEREEAAKSAKTITTGGYIPRPDFEIASAWFTYGTPTLTNEGFAVSVMIKNSGEVAGIPGKIAVFVDQPNIASAETVPTAVCEAEEVFHVGEERRYDIHYLKTPSKGGACHVRVMVDSEELTDELSEGNNQLPLYAWLTPISLSIGFEDGYAYLTWNCYADQVYTIMTASDLSEGFAPYEGEVEILNAAGKVARASSEADDIEVSGTELISKENGTFSIRIPLSGENPPRFFKLNATLLDAP